MTRAQLAALVRVHREGSVSVYRPPAPPGAVTFGTGSSLVARGAAAWGRDLEGSLTIVPVVHTWADGFGWWHAEAPDAATARAAIIGEILARDAHASPRRIRVEHVSGTHFREV